MTALTDHRPSTDEARAELVLTQRRRGSDSRLTILYAARDREHNNAVAVAELLRDGEPADTGP